MGARVLLCPLNSGDKDEEGTSRLLYAWAVGNGEVVLMVCVMGEEDTRRVIPPPVPMLLKNNSTMCEI